MLSGGFSHYGSFPLITRRCQILEMNCDDVTVAANRYGVQQECETSNLSGPF